MMKITQRKTTSTTDSFKAHKHSFLLKCEIKVIEKNGKNTMFV
jgi:hypothetical protein